jgi:predicted dithiol-disulfide oxidoreductase (DUF899 family)
MDRVNFAVVAKSPIDRIMKFARGRDWRHLPRLSSSRNSYNADYHAETADGDQLPGVNVFVKRDGRIHHFYNTEMIHTRPDKGEDPRPVDLIWPLWNLLDMTPDGRGDGWYPKVKY